MPSKLRVLVVACLCLAIATPWVGWAQVWERSLGPSTGFNDLCGEAIFDGVPNFTFSALFNPDGPDPIVLTPEVCDQNPDGFLGTWANPDFYAANGFPLPDPRLLNVLYSRVPIVIDPWPDPIDP